MAERVVPMIHVPDVRATVDWYRGIGFTVVATYGDDTAEGLSFAIVSFGSSEVMFNKGGQPSTRHRREVDLYIYASNVDELYQRLKNRVDVFERPHDTFYGMREFIIRDLNRFWITFGQESVFAVLMNGVREGKPGLVQEALDSGRLKPETINIALASALASDKNAEIVEMLKKAGAVPPPKVSAETLQSYVGRYKGEHGLAVDVTVKDGRLFATPAGQQPLNLWAVDQTTFKPTALDGATVIFNMEAGKTIGITLNQGSDTMQLKRVE